MTNIHVNIDYDEGVAGSYRAVTAGPRQGAPNRFETGDPVADWEAAMTWARAQMHLGGVVMTGSSVTHFVMDDDAWRFIMDSEGRESLVPEDRWPIGTFGMAPS